VLGFIKDKGTENAAAMTYYGIFSLFPLILLFMAMAGLALQSNETARERNDCDYDPHSRARSCQPYRAAGARSGPTKRPAQCAVRWHGRGDLHGDWASLGQLHGSPQHVVHVDCAGSCERCGGDDPCSRVGHHDGSGGLCPFAGSRSGDSVLYGDYSGGCPGGLDRDGRVCAWRECDGGDYGTKPAGGAAAAPAHGPTVTPATTADASAPFATGWATRCSSELV
jgi:hypothetical protein